MKYLILSLDEQLAIKMVEALEPGEQIFSFAGKEYSLLSSNDIFNWILGPRGHILGAELYVFPEETIGQLLHSLVGSRPYLQYADPFIWLWFTRMRDGQVRHDSDWEDYCYISESGEILIVLGTGYLTDNEISQLSMLVEEESCQ